jgi:hypothetical protein
MFRCGVGIAERNHLIFPSFVEQIRPTTAGRKAVGR